MYRILTGVRVIELAGLGPVPMCGLMLKDYGADASIVDNWLSCGKRNVELNLKDPLELKMLKDHLLKADILLDPFKPGALERLDLSPKTLMNENPKLIIGRISGYGQPSEEQSEDYSLRPGHDINYLAESGALWCCMHPSASEPNAPPIFMADMAGGAFPTVIGILLALYERQKTGCGQIVDASITGGISYMCSLMSVTRQHANHNSVNDCSDLGFRLPSPSVMMWPNLRRRGCNLFDGAAPFYRAYETKDKQHVAVGALEPHFYRNLLKGLGIPFEDAPQMDREAWPRVVNLIGQMLSSKTRDEWLKHEDGFLVKKACVSPVWSPEEAVQLRPKSEYRALSGVQGPSPQPKMVKR